MDPALFATTIGALDVISSEIEKYISYAKYLSENKLTSSFALIAESLEVFYKQVFLPDYLTVYG